MMIMLLVIVVRERGEVKIVVVHVAPQEFLDRSIQSPAKDPAREPLSKTSFVVTLIFVVAVP